MKGRWMKTNGCWMKTKSAEWKRKGAEWKWKGAEWKWKDAEWKRMGVEWKRKALNETKGHREKRQGAKWKGKGTGWRRKGAEWKRKRAEWKRKRGAEKNGTVQCPLVLARTLTTVKSLLQAPDVHEVIDDTEVAWATRQYWQYGRHTSGCCLWPHGLPILELASVSCSTVFFFHIIMLFVRWKELIRDGVECAGLTTPVDKSGNPTL